MTKKDEFEDRYIKGDLPWDMGKHDKNLEQVITEFAIPPSSVLELGAGTGSDAIWLTRRGFCVTAVDVSPTALDMARSKASDARVHIEFVLADILNDSIPPGPYDFVFDRGCFHIFDLPEERTRLAEIVSQLLKPAGYWFSLIGSSDGPERDEGPPRRSVLDIALALEPRFEIVSLKAIDLDTNLPKAPRAWACLTRRR